MEDILLNSILYLQLDAMPRCLAVNDGPFMHGCMDTRALNILGICLHSLGTVVQGHSHTGDYQPRRFKAMLKPLGSMIANVY
jgi:hypothetical protein